MLERIKVRLKGESYDDALLLEYLQTAKDRISLRVGAAQFPDVLASIAVEVVLKMVRRRYHEGMKSEAGEGFNPTFFDDVLAEYDKELNAYKASQEDITLTRRGKVRFI